MQAPGHATATLDACTPDPVQQRRTATFSAEMSQLKAGRAMEVRFDLMQRTPGTAFRRVWAHSPGFGVWHPTAPGVEILRYSQQVLNLPAPAELRVQVSFRWLNGRHRIVRRARRLSPSCRMPDLRPELHVGPIAVGNGPGALSSTYQVPVQNTGLAPADGFSVLLSVAGQPLAQQGLAGLAAGWQDVVSFTGPSCQPGATLTVVLDPANLIQQKTRAGDQRTQSC